jgi:biopolymer transport protein ExbD
MTLEQALYILKIVGITAGAIVVLALAIMVAVFFIVNALYIAPYYQTKVNLHQAEKIYEDNRIYVDKAKFITTNQEHQEIINQKLNKIEELQSEIRKLSANKKSLEAKKNSK